tara:strand:- start:775 stop:1581 length:807 start_codon:yes stop_codon:yes gene_type:complete
MNIKDLINKELKKANLIETQKIKEAEVSAGDSKFNLRTGVNKNPTKLGVKIQFEPKGEFLSPDVKNKLEVALQEKLNTALLQYNIQVSKDTDVPREHVIGFFIPISQLKNLIVKALGGSDIGANIEEPKVAAPAPEPSKQGINEAHGLDKKDVNTLKNFLKNHMSKDKDPEVYKVLQFVINSNIEVDQTKDLSKDKEEKQIEEMITQELLNEALRVKDLNEISRIVYKEDFYGFINAGQNVMRTLEENGFESKMAKNYLMHLVKNNIL